MRKNFVQKKITITTEHKHFLDNYKNWGFPDQSSIVREALNHFIEEFQAKERKRVMAQKAHELLSEYTGNKDLTAFTNLDGENFYETGGNLGD